MPGPALLDSARGPGLLCGVALCLLGAGAAHAGVLQSPRHLIKAKGGKSTLKCSPVSDHDTVFWYQQAGGQSLQFLISYYRTSERERGSIPGRFSAQQFSNYSSELNMSALELGDSALYLCASSYHSPAPGLALSTQTFLPPRMTSPRERARLTPSLSQPQHASPALVTPFSVLLSSDGF